MSQAGIASITKAVPSIATSYNGDAGTAVPAINVLNVLGGHANYVTGSSNTLTVDWFKWQTVSGTSQAISVRNAYVPMNVAKTSFTLPITAALGDSFLIASHPTNNANWEILQNAGQKITSGMGSSTVGVLGKVTNTAGQLTNVILCCTEANNIFAIVSCDNEATLIFT